MKNISVLSNKIVSKFKELFITESEPFLEDINGVIHIGANTGQERKIYAKYSLQVIWVEPIPDIFNKLVNNIKGFENQKAFQALVTDVSGKEYEFNVASNGGASSSILKFKDHKNIWPEVNFEKKIKLKSLTLNDLLEVNQVQIKKYQALILDTQGSELLILKGASSLLKNFKYIKVEVPDFESYEGCCKLDEMISFMKKNNFQEFIRNEFAKQEDGKGSYYDIVFKNLSF
jgi:FkbM family methyltransferase